MKTYLILWLFVFVLSFGCNNQVTDLENSQKTINEIIISMVDKKAFPLIPPPSISDTTNFISKSKIDSLKKVKLKIDIYPYFENISKISFEEYINDKFKYLKYSNSIDLNKKYNVESLVSKKGNIINFSDTLNLKQSKEYRDIDLLFNFSKFYFDEDYNTVLFELSISRSSLAGSSSVYILQKENNNWIIKYSKELEIW